MPGKRGPTNPYLAGPPLTGEYGFYGRQNLVEAITDTLITTRQNAIALYGQRRIGKSSLLHRIRRDANLQETHIPIFFDLQLREGLPSNQILVELGQVVAAELELSIPIPDKSELVTDYHQQFQQTILPEVYRQLDQKRLLFLFDEFDVIVPSGAASFSVASDPLVSYLRRLVAQEAEHLAFVFAVGQRLDLLAQGYLRLFKGAHTQPIGRLEKEETLELLTELGQPVGITYASDTLLEIWRLTSGHPYLTQLIGSTLFERLHKQELPAEVQVTDVRACLNKAMASGQSGLEWFWTGFDPREQLLLAAIAELSQPYEGIGDQAIKQLLKEHDLPLSTNDRQKVYAKLIEEDFLKDLGEQHYQFTVEFIRRWTAKYHPFKDAVRQIEEKKPEAINYNYQLGRQAHDRGDPKKAVEYYRQAVKEAPDYAPAYLGLARALRALGKIREAIDVCEESYTLSPAAAREDLIELHLYYARALPDKDTDDIVSHARRVLELDAEHPGARQLLADIYLRQAETSLKNNNLPQAINSIKKLVEPISIISDETIANRIRQLWLEHSQTMLQETPPNWADAHRLLDRLEPLGLVDETIGQRYNQITLEQASVHLDAERLDEALTVLRNNLVTPLPEAELKQMLSAYSQNQVQQHHWTQAEKTLKTLRQLIDSEESRSALQQLYHDWVNQLFAEKKFDEAIAIYHRSDVDEPDFYPRIAEAYLRKAERRLEEHLLLQAEADYRQALNICDTPDIRRQATEQLEAYLKAQQTERRWLPANTTLNMLARLNLSQDLASLQTQLYLAQAQTELTQGRLGTAFWRLTELNQVSSDQIKALVKDYLKQKAHTQEWATGATVLTRLADLLANDQEPVQWQANWLLNWAQALIKPPASMPQLIKGRNLGQEILEIASPTTPLIDFAKEEKLNNTKTSLYHQAQNLLVKIFMAQAQIYLGQDRLPEAKSLFKEALANAPSPKQLHKEIQQNLENFSRRQLNQNNWEQARRGLQVTQVLKLNPVSVDTLLFRLALDLAKYWLEFDRPDRAFSTLSYFKAKVDKPQRQQVTELAYTFSRRYAGRNRWVEARQTLLDLRKWLPAAEQEEIHDLLENLNQEWQDFVKTQHLAVQPEPVLTFEIERLKKKIETLEADNSPASEQTPTPKPILQTNLDLATAYLTHQETGLALEIYKKLLQKNNDVELEYQIQQQVRNYGELLIREQEWSDAIEVFTTLQDFDLPAPDNQHHPDPRETGTLQRIRLERARLHLAEGQIDEAFAQLQKMPEPWPYQQVKELVLNYEHNLRQNNNWDQAIRVLEQLYNLLKDKPPETDVLNWLLDSLAAWAQKAALAGSPAKASELYERALAHARPVEHTRCQELAIQRAEILLHQAQTLLTQDEPLTAQTLETATGWYIKLLEIPESRGKYEFSINQTLHQQALNLAAAQQWSLAYHTLDQLQVLYPAPPDQYRTLFAGWERNMVLEEVRQRLSKQEPQLGPTFERLKWLKTRLEQHNAPGVTWAETEKYIQSLLYGFCQTWINHHKWDKAEQTLNYLAKLLPHHAKIKAWQIDFLEYQAQTRQNENHFDRSKELYQKAITQANNYQDTVRVTRLKRELAENQLLLAQHHLNHRRLDEAGQIYKQLLENDESLPVLADKIQMTLKNYSDDLTQQSPPDWAAARQALDKLADLNLHNTQVFTWRQNLTLQEMRAMLQEDNLDAAFADLKNLEPPWPIHNIQEIVQEYSQSQVTGENWTLAIAALQRLGEILEPGSSARRWLIKQLIALGDQLEANHNLPGAEAAIEAAIEFY